MAQKTNQLAKDFNLKQKDILDHLKDAGIAKSAGASLEDSELDLFLDLLTKAHQLQNLEDYVEGRARIIVASDAKKEEAPKAEAPKAEAPKAETPKAEAPKAEAPKAEAPKAEAPKAAPAPQPQQRPQQPAQGQRPQQGQGQPAQRPQNGQQGQRPQGQPGAQGQRPQNGQQGQRPQGQPGQGQRPQGQGQFDRRPQQGQGQPGQRPQNGQQGQRPQQGQQGQRPQNGQQQPARQSVASTPAPTAPATASTPALDRMRRQEEKARQTPATPAAPAQQKKEPQQKKKGHEFRTIIPTAAPTEGGGEVVVAQKKTRVVDTRTTTVDLSKYDERPTDRFGAGMADMRGERQKLKKQDTRGTGKNARDRDRQAQERLRRQAEMAAKSRPLEIEIPEMITVGELAARMKKTSGEVIRHLMMAGTMATVNQEIDYDTAYLIADEFGIKVTREVVVTIEEKLFDDTEDDAASLEERAPVVCVMGHVDHGKTSLLDAIRNTHVTKGEAGGITQAIGAYRVNLNGKDITFLDTPGHEAFTAMRARGAQATDIAILVVAADDGIMPQTVEAINHAKAAGIDIIVAINKMDKPQANPDAVISALTQYDLVPEEWGGDVICVPVSALTGMGIDDLLESVLLVAEVKELKANPNRRAKGVVLEAKLDRGRGPVATVLVQNGTLNAGDIVIAGTAVGRVRAMTNDKGRTVKEAGPSIPVEIIGLSEVPNAGDEFNAVEDEKMARSLAEQRREAARQEEFKAGARASLDDLFAQMSEGVQDLNIIVKADVDGSAEAVRASLLKLSSEEIRVNVIHKAVGGITESDVMLASASNAIIVGFNVRPDKGAIDSAERQNVEIRTYRIIYECIEEIQAAMKGMLAPEFKEVILGHAEVRQTIHVPGVGTIAGSYVTDGKITRQAQIRVVRDGIVIFEDKISSLKHYKDDVKEMAQGFECGIGLEKFNDIKEGDVLEAFIMEEVARK